MPFGLTNAPATFNCLMPGGGTEVEREMVTGAAEVDMEFGWVTGQLRWS